MIFLALQDLIMTDIATAKLFKHGRSQAVRLPKEFRLPGKEVRVRRIGRALLLEPIEAPFDVDAWFAKLDEYLDEDFMPG
jgi:antitoxin VapB